MDYKVRLKNIADITVKLVQYNLKIIFANRFMYFLFVAFAFFVLVTLINLFSNSTLSEGSIYNLLLLPGILLVFYPTTFGIQNDADAHMLEIIFGIPNYRYKIWLLRILLIYVIVYVILLILALLSELALINVPVMEMVYQLMFPIFLIGSFAFLISTLVRNGYGTAVVMVVIGLVFWIAADALETSKFNLFLNPFELPANINETLWASTTVSNRLIIATCTLVAILWGLLNLQKREKFV